MKRKVHHLLFVILAVSLAAPVATGQAPAAPTSGPRAEYLNNLGDAADKVMRLAEAVPAEKYTWRPAEGVRSFSEVFLHIAAGNFGIPRRLNTPPPTDIALQGLEKSTTDKAKVIEILKRAVANAKSAASNLSDEDLEKTSRWFDGRQITNREVLFFIASHNHEHLGQLIAYARMNGITPPWSQSQ